MPFHSVQINMLLQYAWRGSFKPFFELDRYCTTNIYFHLLCSSVCSNVDVFLQIRALAIPCWRGREEKASRMAEERAGSSAGKGLLEHLPPAMVPAMGFATSNSSAPHTSDVTTHFCLITESLLLLEFYSRHVTLIPWFVSFPGLPSRFCIVCLVPALNLMWGGFVFFSCLDDFSFSVPGLL